MSNRTLRVNELIQREISSILHRRYQEQATAVTVTRVEVSPDLRDGRVFVAVTGGEQAVEDSLRWLRREAAVIRREVGRRIVLKYLPKFEYRLDRNTARAGRVLQLLDELEGREGGAADGKILP